MARLPTGTEPLPLNVRMKGYGDALRARGGHRLVADLEKDANDALAHIVKKTGATRKEAVTLALLNYASKV